MEIRHQLADSNHLSEDALKLCMTEEAFLRSNFVLPRLEGRNSDSVGLEKFSSHLKAQSYFCAVDRTFYLYR